MSVNNNSEELLDLIQDLISELRRLNITVEAIASRQEEQIVNAVPASITTNRNTNSGGETPRSASYDRDAFLEVDDEAIILH